VSLCTREVLCEILTFEIHAYWRFGSRVIFDLDGTVDGVELVKGHYGVAANQIVP
jgi:hypothetical protein